MDFEYSFHNVFLSDIYNMLIESTYDYRAPVADGFQQNLERFGSQEEVQFLIACYLYFKDSSEPI